MARDDLNFSTGDVGGHSLQAHTIRDVHFHPGKAPRPTYDPPRTWADAPQPPPEIQSLLRAQIHAANDSSYRLPGARKPSLDTVYVRQDLGNAVEEPEQPRQGPVLDDDGRLIEPAARPMVRLTVRPPSLTLPEALDGDAHLVVTGGLGKSTLTRRLAAEIAEHWTRRGDAPLSEPVVPLRVTAYTLAARLDVPFAQALADSTAVEYGSLLREPVDKDLFTERAIGCRWLLLVDGLDEVADAELRLRLLNRLAAWASDDAYRILLTTRPTEGGALAPLQRIGAVRYELQPFDAAALERFATNWFPGDDAQRFLHQIREAHLDELVETPLFATIAAIIFGEYGGQPLPGDQYSLYETYLAHIRRGKPDDFDREKLLEHLARRLLEGDRSLLVAARRWVEERCAPNSLSWQEDLTAYLLAVGPFVLRGDDLAFQHHSFAEHLAATSRARDLPDEFCPNAFAELLHAADARESGRFARAVLLHHTRLHPTEADRLLDWLHRGNADQHLLAARLLAHHLPASAAKTEAFLATVWGWAMTTHFSAADILTEATRATLFPCLAEWLLRLMNCSKAPWRSRAEAATALAVRVRGPHTPDAVRFLHRLVDEREASVSDRLVAAEALAQCGTSEREAAERGLRAVLTDPVANGTSVRAAAVILAAFGGDARMFSIGVLTRILSDVDAAPRHVVEVATGLLEIGPEFADICASQFLSLLRSSAQTYYVWQDAALGLASISSAHLDDAVAELTGRLAERRSAYAHVAAAKALCELGPQHRRTAGELIAGLAKSTVRDLDRSVLFGHLITYAPQREAALAGLRKMLGEPHQNWNNFARAASALGKAGPAYRGEAATALLNAGAPLGSHDHVTVLNELVDLGDPHRAEAVRVLHHLVADPDVNVQVRCRAANTLIRSGPDHHPRVIAHLRQLTVPAARREMAQAGGGNEAVAALLDSARSAEVSEEVVTMLANTVPGEDRALAEVSATMLREIARDVRRPTRARVAAANGLSVLSSCFDRESAVELRRIIAGDLGITDFLQFVLYHATNGAGPRQELAEALMEILADERTSVQRAWRAVLALEELGHGGDQEVLASLERLVNFPGLADDDRAEAAVLLASRLPAHLDRAADLVVSAAKTLPVDQLRRFVADLRSFGAEVADRFRVRLKDSGTTPGDRIAVALVLGEFEELRGLAQDELLPLDSRRFALQNAVSVEPDSLCAAAAFLRTVIDDRDISVDERSRAAWTLTQIDRTAMASMICVQWRFAEDPSVLLDDRARALRWLYVLLRPTTPRYEQAAVETLRNPEVTKKAWGQLITTVSSAVRSDLERSRLFDRSLPIGDRLPDRWGALSLRDETVAEIRDVIAAPESTAAERAQAAAVLFEVSAVHQSESVAVLEQLPGVEAGTALAGMSQAHWWRVHDAALAEVEDVCLPFRLRYAAARLLDGIDAELGAVALEVLCATPSWWRRIAGLLIAGHVEAVRKTRDDVEGVAVARVQAAWKLRSCSVDDRAAGAELLENVAADEEMRPALRVRAIKCLDYFGVGGRKRAARVARVMITDPQFPVLARARAAGILFRVERSARHEVLSVLTGLMESADPLQSVRVWRWIGEIDSARAVAPLRAMGRSEPSPVVRMRCARALVEMRRDQREAASVIARAVAWDETVPRHVRCGAARDLARWSELMREDARALLVRLRDCGAR